MRIISILIFFFLLVNVHAQQTRDSLLNLLTHAKEDTNKVVLLIRIANGYEANNQDSAIYYLEKVRVLSESLGYVKGLYHYNERSAIVSFTKGDYSKAMEQSKLALNLARQLKDSSLVIIMLNNIGIVYGYLGKFDEQLNYTLQVKNAIEAMQDSTRLSGLYHNVANCYNNLKQYRKSVDYALLSVKIAVQYKKRNDYINRVYATLAQNYEGLQMIDSALYYYNKAVKTSVELNDKYAEAAIYGYVTNLYANRSQFDKMLTASEKSLSLARALQSRQMVASALYNVAYANYFDGNNIKAKTYIDEALEIATKDTLRDELKNTYAVLSYIAAGDKDYTTSLWARRKSDSIQEAFLNEQVIKSTTELEQKYESAKKDKQIILQKSQLQERRILNYVLIGSAAILLIISLLSYRNYRQKQKLQQQRISELETEKQLTATEAVLKGEEQERTRLAKDLHDGLGGMMSGIKYSFLTMKRNLIMTPENQQAFERSMDMLDSSIQEMRRVAHNMMPEALLKFGLDTALKDLCNDINQTGALHVNYQSIGMEHVVIDQTTSITIYRIVQELINNTMKHAAATNSIVQLSKTGDKLTITVEDDGKGFDIACLNMAKGIGWTNIMNRVEFLKGKLDINSHPGKGTSVLIELNVS
jgi:two-component system, NarL family, sensor kinase